ncbi:MAG: ATP-binding protein [Rhodocyclaceae bacterium]
MSSDVAFDRDFILDDLITIRDADEMATALQAMLGSPVAVLDAGGVRFGGADSPLLAGTLRAPLILELEPVGFLACACAPEALAAAARAVRWGLLSRARFRMVSDLHMEAIRADYAKLQQQNAALKASETRYRELSEALDAKVKEQLVIIDERQRQLYQAERLASIGQLAAGVAHEINNPLGFISSNLSSAERYVADFAELRPSVPAEAWKALDLDFALDDFAELFKDSRAGIDRIARIVKDLKGFSSIDQPDEQIVDLNAQLESLLSVIGGQKPAGVTLDADFAALPPLLCLPGHLNQAFLNILQNALLAVGEQGRVSVCTRATAERITVRIADNGPGIPEDVMPRVFDPFFTTRAVGSGSGLGLTVARDIILAHSGSLSVLNPIEGGTTVMIELPV